MDNKNNLFELKVIQTKFDILPRKISKYLHKINNSEKPTITLNSKVIENVKFEEERIQLINQMKLKNYKKLYGRLIYFKHHNNRII